MLIMIFNIAAALAGVDAEGDVEDVSPDEVAAVVVVTGTSEPTPLSDAPVSTRVVGEDVLRDTGPATLEQALEQTPGVLVMPSVRGVGVSIRGHAPEHVLVLVDGRRTQGRIGGALDLTRFPVERLERVEIVSGPVSSLYGADALGGVIQLFTKRPTAPWTAQATVTGGGYAGGDPKDSRAVFFPASGAGAGLDQLAVDAELSFRKGFVDGVAGVSITGLDAVPQVGDPSVTRLDAVRNIAPWARTGLEVGDHRLELTFDGLMQEGRGADGTATGARMDRLHRTQTWDGSLTGTFALPRDVSLQARIDGDLYLDALRQDQRGSDALDSLERTTARLIRANVQATGWVSDKKRHHLTGGAEVLAEDLAADRIEEGVQGRQRGAAWFEYMTRPLDNPGLTVISGVRVDGDTRFGVAAAPRLAVRLDPHERVTVRVSGGSGWRAPDLRQLYLAFSNPAVGYRVAGNPDLRPERSLGVQADLTVRAHPAFAIDLAAWHDSVRNLIVTDLVGEPTQGQLSVYGYVNAARARVQGLSAALRMGGTSPVNATVGWTLIDADDLALQRPLPGRPEHQGNASLTGSVDRIDLRMSLSATVLGPRPFYTGETDTSAVLTPWTGLLDLAVRWKALRELELFAGVDNLLDGGDPTLDATRPRRVYGGLRVAFEGRGRPTPTPVLASNQGGLP